MQLRSVERYTPAPNVIIWPSIAGRHLRVLVERRERPISIGEGLNLKDEELGTIEEMLCGSG